MSDFKDFILYATFGLFFYFLIVFPIHKWNCERVGMTADYFVGGCIVKDR